MYLVHALVECSEQIKPATHGAALDRTQPGWLYGLHEYSLAVDAMAISALFLPVNSVRFYQPFWCKKRLHAVCAIYPRCMFFKNWKFKNADSHPRRILPCVDASPLPPRA
jgi:hypothetical protein